MPLLLVIAVLFGSAPAWAEDVFECPRDSQGRLPELFFEFQGERVDGPHDWMLDKGAGIDGDVFGGQLIKVMCQYPDGTRQERAFRAQECRSLQRNANRKVRFVCR